MRSFSIRLHQSLNCIKNSEANSKSNGSFHPIHAHSFEESTDTLFFIQIHYCAAHGRKSLLCRLLLYTQTANGRVGNANRLHTPSRYFNGICHRLSYETCKGTTLNSLYCRDFPTGHVFHLIDVSKYKSMVADRYMRYNINS
jgi:hypothetical protein